MFSKTFEVRWSDVDANRHLANSAYINYMSHSRMAYLQKVGFDHKSMVVHNLGPIVFYEHIYYFKEVFPGKPIEVTVEVNGLSEDGMIFEFHHNFYTPEGKHVAHCEMMGAWIDLKTRKLTGLPEGLKSEFMAVERTENFRILTKEDTRKYAKVPQHRV